jgi:hypothetical protein
VAYSPALVSGKRRAVLPKFLSTTSGFRLRNRVSSFLALCGLAGLSSCADTTITPDKSMGALSFRYESATPSFNGTFAAEGFPRMLGQAGVWAGGIAHRSSATDVHAVGGDPTPAEVFITVRDVVTGTARFDSDCQALCNRLVITFTAVGAGRETYACEISDGVLAIRLRAENRVRGNFSGAGTCWSSATTEQPAIRVADGIFDVGLLREE